MAPKGRRRLLIDSEIISPRRAWEFVRDASLAPTWDDALLLMSTQDGARSLRPRCSLQQGLPFSIGCRSLGADLDLDAISLARRYQLSSRMLDHSGRYFSTSSSGTDAVRVPASGLVWGLSVRISYCRECASASYL
jgi:hypothetical protein